MKKIKSLFQRKKHKNTPKNGQQEETKQNQQPNARSPSPPPAENKTVHSLLFPEPRPVTQPSVPPPTVTKENKDDQSSSGTSCSTQTDQSDSDLLPPAAVAPTPQPLINDLPVAATPSPDKHDTDDDENNDNIPIIKEFTVENLGPAYNVDTYIDDNPILAYKLDYFGSPYWPEYRTPQNLANDNRNTWNYQNQPKKPPHIAPQLLPAEKAADWSEMPADCLIYICSYLPPRSICHLMQACKRWRTTGQSNEIWKRVVEDRWPMTNTNAKMKSWMQYYKRRHTVTVKSFGVMLRGETSNLGTHLIENCNAVLKFECPMKYEALTYNPNPALQVKDSRYCDKCKKQVYLCTSVGELNKHVKARDCVVIGTYNDTEEGQLETYEMGEMAAPDDFPIDEIPQDLDLVQLPWDDQDSKATLPAST